MTRRHDPDRRSRIIDATIDVIADHGVAGTTHRRIAAAADVPLGSLTYHFTGLDDLCAEAFRRHSQRSSTAYEAHFASVETEDDLVEAVTDLVLGDVIGDARAWAVSYELYLAALRDPELRTVTEDWMQASRAVLRRLVDPATARGVDALIEGLIMHRTLSTVPVPRAETAAIIRRSITATSSSSSGAAGRKKP